MYPKEIKYTTLSKLKETGNKQQAEITYKNSYIDGRITKVVEEETRFKENPKNASSQNTLTEKTTKTKTFNYDDFGRLIEETTEDGSTIKYIYGTGIKQIERTKNNKTSTEIYEYTTGKLTQITKDGIIIKVDSDNYGNIIKIGNKEIKYNNQNKVRCILENKNTYEYEYNYQGIRTKKIINNEEEINYYLNGNKIIGERKINKTTGNIIEELRYYYDIGGVCGIEYKKDNETYYYNLIKDTLGNISKVMYRGKVIGEYSYDAWGNVSTIIHEDTNPNEVDRKIVGINPYRYKGYYIDIETGLYYCNARYYDPKIYQWIQRDNIEYLDNESLDGLNLYLYCNNDPVNLSDPEGHFAITTFLIFLGVGALVGGTLGGITAYSKGQDIFTGILTGALLGAVVGGIVGIGGVALSGAVSSVLGKTATDLISVVFYDGEFGSWEDYAIAFAFGGLTGSLGNVTGKFAGLAKAGKFVADVALRPATNQLVKMGTRGNSFNANKYLYDVITRAVTYGGSNNVMKSNLFGLNLKVDLGKCFYRSTFKSLYSYI